LACLIFTFHSTWGDQYHSTYRALLALNYRIDSLFEPVLSYEKENNVDMIRYVCELKRELVHHIEEYKKWEIYLTDLYKDQPNTLRNCYLDHRAEIDLPKVSSFYKEEKIYV